MAGRSFFVYNAVMVIKSENELAALREGGHKLSGILKMVKEVTRVGISTKELDEFAEAEILKAGGRPSFKDYTPPGMVKKFPSTLCISINSEVVHGLPGERVLKDGDLVGLDIGVEYKGFFTDMAVTIAVGSITECEKKLLKTCEEALELAISKVKAGVRTGDIGSAVQKFIEKNNFGVVRELVGHGVGRMVHEDPEIPNWGRPGHGAVLRENEVIAIEPMITMGHYAIKLLADGWTWVTRDNSKAAHFEHTLVVLKNGAEILTKAIDTEI